tara:strand:+ start:5696 stop:5881 length:186 start_codon:yes stop_codon:yes gene_type:complete
MINYNTNFTPESMTDLNKFIESMASLEEKAAELEVTVDQLLSQLNRRVTLHKLPHQRMHGH